MDLKDLERMGRRRFLETLSSMGVSATTLSFLTRDTLAEQIDDPDEEVPYVAYLVNTSEDRNGPPERKPVYKTIDREEWSRRQATVDAMERVKQRLSELKGHPSSISVGMTAMDQSPIGFGVTVKYRTIPETADRRQSPDISKEAIRTALPDTVRGRAGNDEFTEEYEDIPVVLSVSESREVGDCYFTDWDTIPGGAKIKDSQGDKGTTTARFYDETVNKWTLATAAHVVDGGDEKVYQPAYARHVGDVVSFHYGDDGWVNTPLDFATFDTHVSGIDSTDYLRRSDSDSYDLDSGFVNGIITDEGIQNNVGNENYEVLQQGHTTCRESGYIVDYNEQWLTGHRNVTHSATVEGGDSGGPLFKSIYDPDIGTDISVILGTVARDEGGVCEGNTAQYIEETVGGYFG